MKPSVTSNTRSVAASRQKLEISLRWQANVDEVIRARIFLITLINFPNTKRFEEGDKRPPASYM